MQIIAWPVEHGLEPLRPGTDSVTVCGLCGACVWAHMVRCYALHYCLHGRRVDDEQSSACDLTQSSSFFLKPPSTVVWCCFALSASVRECFERTSVRCRKRPRSPRGARLAVALSALAMLMYRRLSAAAFAASSLESALT